jgi:hypothetical protein
MSDYVGMYVHFVEPFVTLYHVAVIGIATGAISLFVTKSALLNSFHQWLEKKSPFLEELLSCPWCTSHWVGAFLLAIYQPWLLNWGWRPAWMVLFNFLLIPVDFIVTLMVVVFVAVLAAGAMYKALAPMMGSQNTSN